MLINLFFTNNILDYRNITKILECNGYWYCDLPHYYRYKFGLFYFKRNTQASKTIRV